MCACKNQTMNLLTAQIIFALFFHFSKRLFYSERNGKKKENKKEKYSKRG